MEWNWDDFQINDDDVRNFLERLDWFEKMESKESFEARKEHYRKTNRHKQLCYSVTLSEMFYINLN